MIDIHSHILPGLDDGSESLEESVAMLQQAAAAGTTDIVASPHANQEYLFDPLMVEQKISELQAAVGDAPRIHYGCDFHLTLENIEDALRVTGKVFDQSPRVSAGGVLRFPDSEDHRRDRSPA